MKIIKTCNRCKQLFEFKYPERDLQRGRGKYCSKECQRFGKSHDMKFWELATEQEKLNRLKESYLKKVIIQEGCWGWNGSQKSGYGCMRGEKKNIRAHRVSWMIHKGEIPKDKWILHTCDNRLCSNPEHLFLGDRESNMKDMIQKGRNKGAPGESNTHAKITKDIVFRIREALSLGESVYRVADLFKVSRPMVYQIKNKITWRTI